MITSMSKSDLKSVTNSLGEKSENPYAINKTGEGLNPDEDFTLDTELRAAQAEADKEFNKKLQDAYGPDERLPHVDEKTGKTFYATQAEMKSREFAKERQKTDGIITLIIVAIVFLGIFAFVSLF